MQVNVGEGRGGGRLQGADGRLHDTRDTQRGARVHWRVALHELTWGNSSSSFFLERAPAVRSRDSSGSRRRAHCNHEACCSV